MSFQRLQTVSVCLIVVLVFIEQGTGASLKTNLVLGKSHKRPIKDKINGKYTALNCIFEDENYKTNATIEPIWHTKPNAKIFNVNTNQSRKQQEDNSNPSNSLKEYYSKSGLNFTEWNQFKENVRKAFVESVTTSRLNTVDPFLSFIEAYTKYSGERVNNSYQDLLKFFNEYNVPYWPDENPVEILIQTFDQIDQASASTKGNQQSQERGAYLASAYIQPDLKKGYPELKKKRFQDHVAGVIKFNIGSREGYILLDPGYFRDIVINPFAIVLMQDEKPPHQEIIWGWRMEKIKFSMGDSKDMWVTATYPDYLSAIVNNVVYYLGESYCSFLESTTKGGLLRPEKGIMNFDAQGKPNVFFTLKISLRMDSFSLGHYGDQRIIKSTAFLVPETYGYKFNEIILANNSQTSQYKENNRQANNSQYKENNRQILDNLNVTAQENINKYCKLLGMTTETFVSRIQIFYEKFMKNDDLIGNWLQIASSKYSTTKTNAKNSTKQGLMSEMHEILRLKQMRMSYKLDLNRRLYNLKLQT